MDAGKLGRTMKETNGGYMMEKSDDIKNIGRGAAVNSIITPVSPAEKWEINHLNHLLFTEKKETHGWGGGS